MANGPPEPDWLRLAQIAQDSFQNRRALEWKLAFGFWTGIALITWSLVTVKDVSLPTNLPTILGISYVFVFLASVIFWKLPLQWAHAGDMAWRDFYLSKAHKLLIRDQPKEEAWQWLNPWPWLLDRLSRLTGTNLLWMIGQIAFTAVFLSLSWYVVAFAAPRATPPTPPAPSQQSESVLLSLVLVCTNLFTAVTAGVAIWIAIRQHRTERNKLRFDLYERRYQVYRGVMDLLGSVDDHNGDVPEPDLLRLYHLTDQRRFIFEPDLASHLTTLRERVVRLRQCMRRAGEDGIDNDEREKAHSEAAEIEQWIDREIDGEMAKRFEPYLSFTRSL